MNLKHLAFFAIFTNCNISLAQTPYVDFHTHLTFKHYYNDFMSPDEVLRLNQTAVGSSGNVGYLNWKEHVRNRRAKRLGKESNFKNYYQANFSELKNVNGAILCQSFYPYEKVMTMSKRDRLINNLFISKMSLRRLENIAADASAPFDDFMGEYTFAALQTEKYQGSEVRFAKNSADLKANIAQNVTSYVMTIEGGQAFLGKQLSSTPMVRSHLIDSVGEREILDNIQKIKNLDHRLFFVSPSHFTWNRISGHAKTLDKQGWRRTVIAFLARSEKRRKSMFLKWGEGIHGEIDLGQYKTTDDHYLLPVTDQAFTISTGTKAIAELLKPDNSLKHKLPTYIDIKHMDVQAREDYYRLRDSMQKEYHINIPIIASHVAVSGENLQIARATGLNPLYDRYPEIQNPYKFYHSQLKDQDRYWRSITAYLTGKAFNPFEGNIQEEKAGWFYPWSINLYDEEIRSIHDSDGIMGVMLDGRQLGAGMVNYKKNGYKREIREAFETIVANGRRSYQDFKEYWEVEPLLRNIIYIAENCGEEVCWDHMAIGSDFDGLIDPMKICSSTASVPVFREKLNDYLAVYLQIHGQKHLLGKLSEKEVVDKLFYNNGQRFILKYF